MCSLMPFFYYFNNASIIIDAATAPGSFVPVTCSIFKYDERPANGFIFAVSFAPFLALSMIISTLLPATAASAAGNKLSRHVR